MELNMAPSLSRPPNKRWLRKAYEFVTEPVRSLKVNCAVPLGAALFALGLAVMAPSPAPAQDDTRQRITIDEGRQLGFSLLQQGQPLAAKAVAEGLLQRDDADVSALLILSRAERLLGEYDAAASAGRRAWRSAKSDAEKYGAAVVTAQAVSSGGSKLRGQVWLRRAVEAAPNDALRAGAIRDFRYLRATSPIAVNLQFSVSPTSNINNGTRHSGSEGGLWTEVFSGDARALSGLRYVASARLRYRLKETERVKHGLGLSLHARAFSLSSGAKEQAPNASAGDYAFEQITASYDLSRVDADGQGLNFASFSLGSNWYGGSSLSDFIRISAGRRMALNKTNILQWGLSGERQWRRDEAIRSATIVTASTNWTHVLAGGNQLTLGAHLRDTNSDSPGIANNAIGVNATYNLSKPIFANTGLNLSLGYEARDYEQNFLGIMREDRRTTLSATMTFRDIDYYGFSPTATLSASRTSSTVSRFDTEEFGLNFGLRSSF